MTSAHASHVHSPGTGLASWYTPGRSDGFGDRLLMFDNTDAISLELLRFRPELVTTGFENALRDRVEHLAQFRHPVFPMVRGAVHLDGEDLTLVGAHTTGQRLSELPIWKLRKGLHPAVVTWIVRELTPALAALQSSGPFVAHGTLNTDRIVVASEGRLCIVEHALGAAVRRLRLTPAVFWRQFGLLAPVDEKGLVRIDQRTDVVQLGVIALSLLLGRPVTLHDFERGLPALLDEFTALAATSPSVFTAPLRVWLERALQLAPRPYRSARDAQEGLHELPVPARPAAALGSAPPQARAAAGTPDRADAGTLSVSHLETRRPLRPQIVRELPAAVPLPVATETFVSDDPPQPTSRRGRWRRAYTIGLSVTLGAIALGEAAIIARLDTRPAVISVAAPAPAPAPSLQPAPEPPVAAAAVVVTTSPAVVNASNDDADAAIALAAARQRSGGVRLSTSIELTVFEGDRILGKTADGPIVTTAGTHQLDLVNTALGYRSRQTVTIRAGVIAPLTLPVPMGRMNINAQPWAQVLIDDNPVGETPLANISLPLGQHQITFRHPQLGERRETVIVRADTVGRVSVSFER
jgi:hypothetical protein